MHNSFCINSLYFQGIYPQVDELESLLIAQNQSFRMGNQALSLGSTYKKMHECVDD